LSSIFSEEIFSLIVENDKNPAKSNKGLAKFRLLQEENNRHPSCTSRKQEEQKEQTKHDNLSFQ